MTKMSEEAIEDFIEKVMEQIDDLIDPDIMTTSQAISTLTEMAGGFRYMFSSRIDALEDDLKAEDGGSDEDGDGDGDNDDD